jgi:hypothetical protein
MNSATIIKKQMSPKQSEKKAGKVISLPVISKEEFIGRVNKRAYEYYLGREAHDGSPLADWLRAEKEFLEKYRVAE